MRDSTVSSPIKKRAASHLIALRYGFLLALCLSCFGVKALSPGELKILSSGQQPLKAEILMPRTDQGNPDDILAVAMASPSTYAQAGLQYSDYLNQLKLRALPIGGGLLIEVSASQPLEIKIGLLLEFTTSAQQYVHFYSLENSAPANQITEQRLTKSSSNSNQGRNVRTHRVVQGDTLWNIAKRLRPEEMTVAETMNQLFSANPDAFQNGDSTQIKLGYLLNFSYSSDSSAQDGNREKLPNQLTIIPRVDVKTDEVSAVVETPLSAASVTDNTNNEEALQEILQELAKEIDQQAQSVASVEGPFTAVSPQQEDDQANDQVVVQPYALETFAEDSAPLTKNQSIIQSAQEYWQLLVKLSGRLKAMLDWHFVYDPADDYRQFITLPWLGSGLLLLALIILLKKSLFKSRSKKNNQQAENLTPDTQPDVDMPREPSIDIDSDAYVENKSDSLDNTAPTSDDGGVEDAEKILDYGFDGDNLDGQAIAFPGLEELDAQMSEEFLVDQSQSAYQPLDNSEDMDDIDPIQVRLDMATICLEMDDKQTAREILREIILEAEEPARAKAQAMLNMLGDTNG